jgi:RNA polymerase sigma-70 factor, ECF subfamily
VSSAAAKAPRRAPAWQIDDDAERRVLELWKRGERDQSFRLLMSMYGGRVLDFARRLTHDEAIAQDIRQQTFLEIWRGLDHFGERARLWTWVCAIAHNRSIDAARRQRRIGAGEVAIDFDVLEAVAPASEQPMDLAEHQALELCLKQLRPEIRAQVLMRYAEGLSHAEIGKIIGDAEGTVQVRLGRVLPKLRRCLRAKGASR